MDMDLIRLESILLSTDQSSPLFYQSTDQSVDGYTGVARVQWRNWGFIGGGRGKGGGPDLHLGGGGGGKRTASWWRVHNQESNGGQWGAHGVNGGGGMAFHSYATEQDPRGCMNKDQWGPPNQWVVFWGFILVGDPLDHRGPWTLSTLCTRLLHPCVTLGVYPPLDKSSIWVTS